MRAVLHADACDIPSRRACFRVLFVGFIKAVSTFATFLFTMNSVHDRLQPMSTDPMLRNRCTKRVTVDALVLFHLHISTEMHLLHGSEILYRN